MASVAMTESDDDLNWRGKRLWSEKDRVYTRRKLKKPHTRDNNDDNAAASTLTTTTIANSNCGTNTQLGKDEDVVVQERIGAPTSENVASLPLEESLEQERSPLCGLVEGNVDSSVHKLQDSILINGSEVHDPDKPSSPVHVVNEVEDWRPSSSLSCRDGLSCGSEIGVENSQVGNELGDDGEPMQISDEVVYGGGAKLVNVNHALKPLVISRIDDRVRFKLAKATSKNEIKGLRTKLEFELDLITKLVKSLESPDIEEIQPGSYSHASYSNFSNGSNGNCGGENGNIGVHISDAQHEYTGSDHVGERPLAGLNSDLGRQETMPLGLARVDSDAGAKTNLETRPNKRQLTVSVMETNHGSCEYVEKEKRTPNANQCYENSEFLLGKDKSTSESAKRSKTSDMMKHNEQVLSFGFGSGKKKNQVYKSCTGLLQRLMKHKHGWVFNKPVDTEAMGLVDYHDIIKHPMDLGTIRTRLSRHWYKTPIQYVEDVRLVFTNAMTYNPKGHDVHTMAEQLSQIFEERWAVIETQHSPSWKHQIYQNAGLPTPSSREKGSVAVEAKVQHTNVVRTPVLKKPHAKDPNKRDMTYEEKQKLSACLEKLPPEKLDAIIQIIKKRNTAVSQNDDEIEVDIDIVDAETLWELDRFVTNYKKNLSKRKRRAQLAFNARSVANVADLRNENGTAFGKTDSRKPPAVDAEIQGKHNENNLDSSSSSSSDSGSSSSDSE